MRGEISVQPPKVTRKLMKHALDSGLVADGWKGRLTMNPTRELTRQAPRTGPWIIGCTVMIVITS